MISVMRGGPATIVRMRADEATAKRIIDRLADGIDLTGLAVGAYESGDHWVIEARFPHAPDRKEISEWVRQAAGTEIENTIAIEPEAIKDWVSASLEGLKPVRVGRFVIYGAHDRHRIAPNRVGIEIEAALAFGTGHHGTTCGCLEAIDRIARRTRPKRILDIGTGSGVLAIAAARVFRRPVVGGEIDPVAVSAARRNARLNRVGNFVHMVQADRVRHPVIQSAAPYDLVLANILLSPLQRLMRPVRMLLARRATVVLSGLLPVQANAALASWRAQGLVLRRRRTIENWTTLTLRLP